MFHVKHPVGRNSGHVALKTTTKPSRCEEGASLSRSERTSTRRRCRRSTTASSHRSWSGGSLITMGEPARTSRAAADRVNSGGPNPRATTASNEWAGPNVATSWHITATLCCQPRRRTTRSKKSVRLARRSSRVTVIVGRSCAITRPGMPPPEPRSRTELIGPRSSRARTNPRACSMTSGIWRDPRNPSRCASSNTATRAGSTNALTAGLTGSGRVDDDPTVGVLTDRAARHTLFVVEDVVDHLAVRRTHRLEGSGGSGGPDLFGHVLSK